MTFVDTNVLIDIFERDPVWFEWSATQLSDAAAQGGAHINCIVLAELSRGFMSLAALQGKLAQAGIDTVSIDDVSAFTAGHRHAAYRKLREADAEIRVLPDFMIGAHAMVLQQPLLTRDARLYRRYFPELTLITPGPEKQ